MRPSLGLAVILTVAFLIVGCSSSDDTADRPTTAAPDTTVAPAATVAAKTEATTTTTPTTSPEVVASFDGERWSYEGPDQVTATEPLSLSFTNESDVKAGVDNIGYGEGVTVEELQAQIGRDYDMAAEGPPETGRLLNENRSDPGETISQNTLMLPGVYSIVGVTFAPDITGPDRVRTLGVFEVVVDAP